MNLASFSINSARVPVIQSINCTGYESSIDQCQLTIVNSTSSSSFLCPLSETASVSCNPGLESYTC